MTYSRRTILKSMGVLAAASWIIPDHVRADLPLRIGVIGAGSLGGTVGRRVGEGRA
jgi:hypothetical protein